MRGDAAVGRHKIMGDVWKSMGKESHEEGMGSLERKERGFMHERGKVLGRYKKNTEKKKESK